LSVLEDWPGHHPLLCWTVIYTMAFVFEAMGYKAWEVERVACVGHGGSHCASVLRYRK
jgi:predicted hydrocarbon binding protein